jgi:hypothetical protein
MINSGVLFCSTLAVGLLIFLIPKLAQRDELDSLCKCHEAFYREKIRGSVVEHRVDSADHARREIVIRDRKGRDYEVFFIPYPNWDDFDQIKIADSIAKDANSLTFTVNEGRTVTMQFDCHYLSVN